VFISPFRTPLITVASSSRMRRETAAVGNAQVREALAGSLREIDEVFRAAFSAAQRRGELGPQADPKALAMFASAVVHTLALRARAGQPRAILKAVADSAAKLICSSGGAQRKSRGRAKD